MFLKSLSLKGFKSFAEPTLLEMEPGVTVVVGPNGSGKSNVVDAIAWVLGAQAPSAVRSQKMDDVIFAGTEKRPALGRAEVALTIDNSSRLLPIDFEEVTITRVLFRDGDSEYQINGVPCRLLDVQELLSDTGVGRQQHVIVSQGQIDGVLNARPEDRRAIIEEAAGVLKFRRRREKAERRLAATEDNLTRVQDLLREVRRQLRPLERQAEAARRHGDLVTELHTLQKHLAGREIQELRGRLQVTRQQRRELEERDAALRSKLRAGDEEIAVAESRLSETGADDIGDRLARVEGLRERARGLHALLNERIAGLRRELDASVDQGVIETLEAETARLRSELADVDATREALEPDRERLHAAEAQIAQQRSLFEQEWSDAPAVPRAEAAELRGQLAAVTETVDALEATSRQLSERLVGLGEAETALLGQVTAVERALGEATDELADLAARAGAVAERVAAAERACGEADDRVHRAEADHRAWTARADALAMALDDARTAAGVERLDGIDGVVGPLLELIDIDEGWESAFEAAAGSALAAVVVRDLDSARAALAALREQGAAGGVLALGPRLTTGVGGELRRHVRSRHRDVELLLDRLVGEVGVVSDWAAGIDAALAEPTRVFVTRRGDRLAPDGWRVGLSGTGATGVALEEALEAAESAVGDLEARRRERDRWEHEQSEARAEQARLDQRTGDVRAEFDDASARFAALESDLRATRVEAAAVRTQLAEVNDQLGADTERHAQLLAALPAAEADERDRIERNRELDEARQRLERESAEVGARRTEHQVRVAAVEERRQFLMARLAELDARLDGYADARAQAGERRRHIEKRLAMAAALDGIVERRGGELEVELDGLRARRQAQSDAARAAAMRLDQLRRTRQDREGELAEVRELATRAELEEGEITLKLEAVVDALRRDLDCEPGAAVATQCPPLDGVTPRARMRELERELRIMGPINPLALEEYEALQERHQFLQDQLDDVRGSRRELNKVIRAIDDEIVTVFSAAFADVASNFELLFQSLFPGGTGRLRLTSPHDLLNTGIEIEAKPSGKNVKKLSLLSGGERSLTALGFLFAVFRSRPSPFYVMDEVEAALDDVNLHRFLSLVREFRDEAQLIIVSHQKRTMEAADCLYGITMQPGGSSKALSEKPGAEIDLTDPLTAARQGADA